MFKKWHIRFISISILFLFVFSVSSNQQLIIDWNGSKTQPIHLPLSFISQDATPSTCSNSLRSNFQNIGLSIFETDEGINSLGLCMETTFDYSNYYYSISLVVTTYDKNGIFLYDHLLQLDDDIIPLKPIRTTDKNYLVCGGVSIQDSPQSEIYPVIVKINDD
ncbi:MAG: hypothetical protein QCI00_07405, partial [Candidatus Thermoplasmatota archaeon]|nr:hypothetical protein [Candidatus Thermoplasmatota archaeon]